jgi:Peptidase of plants and bacteria
MDCDAMKKRMHQRSLSLLAVVLCLAAPHGRADEKSSDPKSGAVQVEVDTSEVPDLKDWGDKAKALVEKWHPIIADLLKTDGFTPPFQVKIVFKKEMKGVAFTSGNTITIAADWIKKQPDDYGMVVHELTHVVQSYPRTKREDGWLVEGIADYVRFYKYEPNTKLGPVINPDATYRLGYRAAARFLAWIEKTHDKEIVSKLNQALRKSEYKDKLFKDVTGMSLDDLWAEFLKSEKK